MAIEFTKDKMARSVSIYDRPSVALANMMQLKPGAAARALFSPDTLSPGERRLPHQLLGLGSDNKIIETSMRIASNPLLWIGLAMSYKFKIASPGAMLKHTYSEPVGGLTAWMHSPTMRVRHIPGFGDKLKGVAYNTSDYLHRYSKEIDGIVQKYRKATGKNITEEDSFMLGAYLQGWHLPKAPAILSKKEWGGHLSKIFKIDVDSLVLAPGLDKKMSPQLKTLASDIRTTMDKMFLEVLGADTRNPSAKKKIIEELRQKGVDLPFSLGADDIVDNYLPRILYDSPGNIASIREGGLKGIRAMTVRLLEGKHSGRLIRRTGNSLPSENHLNKLVEYNIIPKSISTKLNSLAEIQRNRFEKDLSLMFIERQSQLGLSNKVVNVLKDRIKNSTADSSSAEHFLRQATPDMEMFLRRAAARLETAVGGKHSVASEMKGISNAIASPKRYGVSATKALERYVSDLSPQYGWHTTGLGKQIMEEMKTSPYMDERTRNMLSDTVLPLLRGIMPASKYNRQLAFNEYKLKTLEWLDSNDTVKKLIPERAKNWIADSIMSGQGVFSGSGISSAISNHYYLAMLGFNTGAGFKNSLQSLASTIGITGPSHLVSGYSESAKRFTKFLHKAKTVGREEAFKYAFPEYYKQYGYDHDMAKTILYSATETGRNSSTLFSTKQGIGKVKDKISEIMMSPFAATEKVNRITSFYAGRSKALAGGLSDADASKFGELIVDYTQFPGGTLGMPSGLLNVPAPMRQLMHFTTRYGAFLRDTLKMGEDPNKINLHAIGNILAAGTVAGGIGKGLFDTDVTGGLVAGAVPQPSFPGQPFYPFTFVPPLVSTIGHTVAGIYEGNPEHFKKAAATLIPSGVAGRRALLALSPKYADYKNKGTDGKIPLYNDKKQLIGRFSQWELARKAAGLNPFNMQEEREMMGYVISQREIIREYRSKYLLSIINNDLAKASAIKNEFKKRYPQFKELQVHKSDIEAAQNKRQITRLERVVKGFRVEDQPVISRIINDAIITRTMQHIDKFPNTIEVYQSPLIR